MNIFIRVDASIILGYGHVMRCLALAEGLRSRENDVTFMCRVLSGDRIDLIKQKEFSVVSLPHQVGKKTGTNSAEDLYGLGVPWEIDAEQTGKVIENHRPDWLIVDHYGIDGRWHRMLRKYVSRIMVIDDLANRELDCDLLLDQTYGRREDDYLNITPDHCRRYIGSRYALLRREFHKTRQQAIDRRTHISAVKRILVIMGGTDPENMTGLVLKALSNVPWTSPPFVDVVLGGHAPHLDKVREEVKGFSFNVNILPEVGNISSYILDADLAIGAAGTTSWERCCLGLPSIIIVTADNQRTVAKQLVKAGAAVLAADEDFINYESITDSVTNLIAKPEMLRTISDACFRITDGLGVRRVVLALDDCYDLKIGFISFRNLMLEDADLLFKWQCDPKTRKYFNNSDMPDYKEHVNWVKRRIQNVNSYTDIIMCSDEPVGVIRLDPFYEKDSVETEYLISIYIAPDKFRQGIAKTTIKVVCDLFNDVKLVAEIQPGNEASLALFKGCGFVASGKKNLYVRHIDK